MDMDFSPEDLAFREEVRAFLAESLPVSVVRTFGTDRGID